MRRANKKKGVEAQRAKIPTPTRAFDAFIWDDLKRRKQKKEQKERSMEWIFNPVTPDHFITSYDPHGLYSGPILKPSIHRDIYIYIYISIILLLQAAFKGTISLGD